MHHIREDYKRLAEDSIRAKCAIAAKKAGCDDIARMVSATQKACAKGNMTPEAAVASVLKWNPTLSWKTEHLEIPEYAQ